MTRYLCLALVITALLMSACSGNKTQNLTSEARKEILRAEMLKWENFSAEGVAQLNYMGLTLRKMFVLSKTRDELRFDVIDGGIMGAGAAPLISVYLGDYFSLRSDFMPQLAIIARTLADPRMTMAPLRDINALVDAYADSILATGRMTHLGIEISFTPELRLQRVFDPKSKSEVLFSYSSKGQPDKLVLKMDGAGADLLIDAVSYGEASLEPLPRQEGSILDQFRDSGLMDEIAPPEEEDQ